MEVRCQERLGMRGRLNIKRDVVRIRVAVRVQIHGGFDTSPFRLRHGRKGLKQVGKTNSAPPCNFAPAFYTNESGDLFVQCKALEQGSQVKR